MRKASRARDGFGLAARKGGRELGLGGAAFAWYTTLLKDSILDVLSDDERIRRGSYQVTVRVWLTNAGGRRAHQAREHVGQSRARRGDRARARRKIGRVREAPPLEMPQPVTLRIVSRG